MAAEDEDDAETQASLTQAADAVPLAYSDETSSQPVIEYVEPSRWRRLLPGILALAGAMSVGVVATAVLMPKRQPPSPPPHAPAPAPSATPPPPPPAAPAPTAAPGPPPLAPVSIDPAWPPGWQNAARAGNQVPPAPGMCYNADGSPVAWENFVGPAIYCTPPKELANAPFLPLPPHDRGVLPTAIPDAPRNICGPEGNGSCD